MRRLALRAVAPAVSAKRRVQVTLLVLLVLLAAVLATGVFAAYGLYHSAEDRYIGVVFPLRTATRDVVLQMVDEQTGVRGYMITNERRSLIPYFNGRKGVEADLQQFVTLTREHPELAGRLQVLRSEITALHGYYDRLITFVADGQLGQRRARAEVLDGQRLFNRFRSTAALMQSDIERFVESTRASQRSTYNRALATLGIAGFLALTIAATLLFNVPERLRLLYAAEAEARQRAEQGANAARALAHVSDAVLLVDAGGRIRSWNAAAERLFGVAAGTAVWGLAERIVPEYRRLVEKAGERETFVPVQIAGEERWLVPTLSSFDGGTVLTIRDATAGYLLERARADFVTTASHELRTPLTAIYGGVRTLVERGDRLDEEQRQRLMRVIDQESTHLAQIVDQMLVTAELDRGSLRLNEEPCDLRALCASVVEGAEARKPERTAITLQTPADMAPLRCDASLLRQVLVNLVENALKYSPDGGRVEVRVVDEPRRVRIAVRDQGLGIPLGEQERIFEKFYRLDAEMARGVGGSGLGLYISREIVAQMGGTLSVESAPGAGSTFTVTLPRRSE